MKKIEAPGSLPVFSTPQNPGKEQIVERRSSYYYSRSQPKSKRLWIPDEITIPRWWRAVEPRLLGLTKILVITAYCYGALPARAVDAIFYAIPKLREA